MFVWKRINCPAYWPNTHIRTISNAAVWKRDFLEPPKLWTFVKGSLLFSCRHAKTVFENVDNVPLLIQDPASYKQAEYWIWQFNEWLGKKTHYVVCNFDGLARTTDRKQFKTLVWTRCLWCVVVKTRAVCTGPLSVVHQLTTYFTPLTEHSLNCMSFSVSVPVLSVNTYSTYW